MHARLERCAHKPMLPIIVPTIMKALVVRLRGVGDIIVCQVDRLLLPTPGDLDQRSDVAVAQCTRELQASVDEHADALAEKFFGSDGRPELASLLARVADLVEPALDPGARTYASVRWLSLDADAACVRRMSVLEDHVVDRGGVDIISTRSSSSMIGSRPRRRAVSSSAARWSSAKAR
jgi:hypothetical protein